MPFHKIGEHHIDIPTHMRHVLTYISQELMTTFPPPYPGLLPFPGRVPKISRVGGGKTNRLYCTGAGESITRVSV